MDWGSCLIQGVATLQCVPIIFVNVLNFLFMVAGTVAVFVIIISGLRLIMAAGDAKKLDTARHVLTYAILGLLIILFSEIILNIIATVTGVRCLLVFGPFTNAINGINNCTK